MGERPGVRRLVGAVHDDLQIVQQCRHVASLITWDQLRLRTDHRQWWTFRGRTDPLAEQIARLMQKVAQNRIRVLGRGEGWKPGHGLTQISAGVHRKGWSFADPRLSWECAHRSLDVR